MIRPSDRVRCARQLSFPVFTRQDVCSRGQAYIISSGPNLRPSRRGVRPGSWQRKWEHLCHCICPAVWTAACSHRQSTQCLLSQQHHNDCWLLCRPSKTHLNILNMVQKDSPTIVNLWWQHKHKQAWTHNVIICHFLSSVFIKFAKSIINHYNIWSQELWMAAFCSICASVCANISVCIVILSFPLLWYLTVTQPLWT